MNHSARLDRLNKFAEARLRSLTIRSRLRNLTFENMNHQLDKADQVHEFIVSAAPLEFSL